MKFENHNRLFSYDLNQIDELTMSDQFVIPRDDDKVHWLNVYGFEYEEEFKSIVQQNKLDEFLLILFQEEDQKNTLIDMEESIYLTINVLVFENDEMSYDKIRFFYQEDLIWTVQEKVGDYFDNVRDYLRNSKGIIRKRKADYLLYKLIEAILNNYQLVIDQLIEGEQDLADINQLKPDPDYLLSVEQLKQDLHTIKKSLLNIKELLTKLETWMEVDEGLHPHYFSTLKEEASFMADYIDFQLQNQESKINLIFNIQSHRLNEVMKTLTIFSVIFIPLTFLAGIYGMNFDNIPELHAEYGYFILLGVMLLLTLISIIYFKRKKWF